MKLHVNEQVLKTTVVASCYFDVLFGKTWKYNEAFDSFENSNITFISRSINIFILFLIGKISFIQHIMLYLQEININKEYLKKNAAPYFKCFTLQQSVANGARYYVNQIKY